MDRAATTAAGDALDAAFCSADSPASFEYCQQIAYPDNAASRRFSYALLLFHLYGPCVGLHGTSEGSTPAKRGIRMRQWTAVAATITPIAATAATAVH